MSPSVACYPLLPAQHPLASTVSKTPSRHMQGIGQRSQSSSQLPGIPPLPPSGRTWNITRPRLDPRLRVSHKPRARGEAAHAHSLRGGVRSGMAHARAGEVGPPEKTAGPGERWLAQASPGKCRMVNSSPHCHPTPTPSSCSSCGKRIAEGD
jgi:hypothetical protein